MRGRLMVFLILPLLVNAAPPIEGRWRSVTTTRGGIGAVYVFQANGSATYSAAAIADADYRLDANHLTFGGQSIGIGWHADGALQLNYGNNEVEDFVRQGRAVDPVNPIVGEWKGSRMIEGRRLPVTLQFHTGNRALLVIFLKTLAGRYEPGASPQGEWMLTLPSLPQRKIVDDSATGQLSITAAGGDTHPFTRF